MNTSAVQWKVQIQGGESELDYLSRHFSTPQICICMDNESGSHVLCCDTFEPCSTSEAVFHLANEQLVILSGILRLTRDSSQMLRTGAVYRRHADGHREIIVRISEGVQARAECGVLTVSVTDAFGNLVAHQPPPAEHAVVIATLARSDVSVAKAMRLLATDSKDWVALYRMCEVIEADVGGDATFREHCWGSAKQMRRFKHSANSVVVAGDAARHGKENGLPPSNPMSIDEANAYVNYVLHAWLASKGA